MSQDNSEAALIPIGFFAVVAVVHENADKMANPAHEMTPSITPLSAKHG